MLRCWVASCLIAFTLVGCRSPQAVLRQQVRYADNPIASHPIDRSQTIGTVEGVQSTMTVSIEELVELGLANSPLVEQARHRVAAKRHQIALHLSLPDPMITTNTHLEPIETAAGRQAFSAGFSQKFVDVDRRATQAAIAHEDVRIAQADLSRVELELAEKIRVACLQLLTVRETKRIAQEDFESLAKIEEVILRQFEVKKEVTQQDVLNVQVEQSKVENQLTELTQREVSLMARVARLVHLPMGSEILLSDSIAAVSKVGDVEDLINQALASRPELASQLARIRKQCRRVGLARLQNRPDLTVGLNWIATSTNGISPVANGDDALLLGVGFNLPIYKERIRAAMGEAQESQLAEQAGMDAIQIQISEEVFDTVAQLESSEMTLSLLEEDILPKSEKSLALSIEGYANGTTDYTQLIEMWRSVLKYRMTLVALQSQRMQLAAKLARQIGQRTPVSGGTGPLNGR